MRPFDTMEPMNWQRLKTDKFETYRAAVPGGWLVLVKESKDASGALTGHVGGLSFLPDSDHAWDGTDPLASPLGLRDSG